MDLSSEAQLQKPRLAAMSIGVWPKTSLALMSDHVVDISCARANRLPCDAARCNAVICSSALANGVEPTGGSSAVQTRETRPTGRTKVGNTKA